MITVERYIAVSHPFLARHVCTSSRARLGILLVLTAAIIYNIPRFLEYDVSYDNGTVSEVPWLRGSLLYYYVYYTGFFLLTHFLVPFSIITVLNSLAAIRISQAKQQRKLLTSQQQSEHKTTSMMIVVIILFLFCNTLPFVLNLVEAFDMQLFINDTSMVPAYLVLDISNTLVVINSSSTFIIYYNFSQKYKLLVLRLLRREELDSTALEFTTHTHSGSIHYRGLSQKSHDRTVANGVLIAEKSSGERRSTELRKVVAQDDSESPLITWLSHDRQVGSRLAQSNNNEWLPGATNGT